MTFQAIFQQADDGTIWAYIPELPGALGSGDTMDEAKASIEVGAGIWIAEALANGQTIPKATTLTSAAVEVIPQ
jgi:predicted RNase H-like HicB family nuclease